MQNNPPLTKEELLAKTELLALAIEVAFREKLYKLLVDPNTDPELLLTYLKMNEKREAMKLKEMSAQLKEREVALKEATSGRKLALDERKQALNEKKFQIDLDYLEESAAKEKASSPKPNEAPKPNDLRSIDSRVPAIRNGHSVEPLLRK
jgi:hypothetical protein